MWTSHRLRRRGRRSLPSVTPSAPFTSWTGWDIRGGSSSRVDVGDAFARSVPGVPGSEVRYELLAVARRGFRPPRFLRTVEVVEDLAPQQHEPEPGPTAGYEGLRQTWSLLYRCVTETGPPVVMPYGVYLLGVNPPADATDDELEVFNNFYTSVHLVEVAERRHTLRAVRYELFPRGATALPGCASVSCCLRGRRSGSLAPPTCRATVHAGAGCVATAHDPVAPLVSPLGGSGLRNPRGSRKVGARRAVALALGATLAASESARVWCPQAGIRRGGSVRTFGSRAAR